MIKLTASVRFISKRVENQIANCIRNKMAYRFQKGNLSLIRAFFFVVFVKKKSK